MKYFSDHTSSRARQEGGDHYLNMALQPWDALKAWLSGEQWTGFLLGNVIKYLARFNCRTFGKGGLPDLLKARHYLDRPIEEESHD